MLWSENDSLAVAAMKSEKAYKDCDWDGLLNIPTEVLTRCWQALEANPADADAGDVLRRHYSAGFDATDDASHLCGLSRLLDVVHENSNSAQRIGNWLMKLLEPRLRRAMAESNIHDDVLVENGMWVIEKTFYEGKPGPENALIGALLMAGQSGLAQGIPEFKLQCFAYGMRAAYGFFRCDRPEEAESALRRCGLLLVTFEDDIGKDDRLKVGLLLKAAAIAAHKSGYFDQQVMLLQRAAEFLPSDDEEFADCMLHLGQELERRGKLVEGLEAYERGRSVADITDEMLKGLLKESSNVLRANLEGTPEKLFNAVEGLAETFGQDARVFVPLRRVADKLLARVAVSEADNREMIEALEVAIDVVTHNSGSDDDVLSLYNLMLKSALELDDRGVLNTALPDLIARAQRYAKGAKPETLLEFSQIKSHCQHIQVTA